MTKNSSNINSSYVRGSPISAREVGFWAVLVVSVAYWSNIARVADADSAGSLSAATRRVLDNGVFDVLAWIVIYAAIGRIFDARPATWRQIGAAFLAGLVALIPVRLAVSISLAILGVNWLRGSNPPRARRDAGLILLALAVQTVWLSPLMPGFHLFVTRLDASVVVTLLDLLGMVATAHGDVVANVTMGFSMSIWPYCSSSLPLAGVTVAFVVTLVFLGGSPGRRHLPWLAMSCLVSVVLTEIRLVAMAAGPDNYIWLHDGPGRWLWSMLAMGAAVLFPVISTRVANRSVSLVEHRGIT